MKRLILSTIPDDFDPDRDIPLGPWCFLGMEEIYPEWEKLPFQPEPFPSPESLANASRLTCNYANELIPVISEELNKLNGTKHSNKFWRLMIMPWLLTLIQALWDRENRLLQFIEKYKNIKMQVSLSPADAQWNFKDSADCEDRGILNPDYNDWLYSRILEQNRPGNWEVLYNKGSRSIGGEHNSLQSINKYTLKEKLIELSYYLNNRWFGVYGVNPIESMLWSLYLSLKPVPHRQVKNRSFNNTLDGKVSFKTDITNILWASMPECFKDIKSLKTKIPRTKYDRLNIVGTGIYHCEKLKYLVGLRIEGGEKIVCTQHGAGYGALQVWPYDSEVEYKQYCFFSWGWSEHEDYKGNIIPLPSPLLTKFKDRHTERISNMILVGTLSRIFAHRLISIPHGSQQIDYRKNKIDFLKHLKHTIFENTLYRFYPDNHAGALKDLSYIKKLFPEISICEGNLHSAALKCRLLVLDHPGTTLNIALAGNIPTIGFWRKTHYPMCRQFIPYMDNLKRLGLIFETGKEAAEQVNEIWDDVQGWWSQPSIQTARKEFCNEHARTSRFWRFEWAKTLWKL